MLFENTYQKNKYPVKIKVVLLKKLIIIKNL